MAKRVIVVGGGIIGASFAYHLSKAGAAVQLVEENPQIGGVATPKSWAWINASWGNPRNYFRLRMHAMQLWRGLDKDVPGLQLRWCGGLLWDLPPAQLKAYVHQHELWGYDIKLVDAAGARRIEPNLLQVPEIAAYAAGEGVVEPVHAVQKLTAAAVARGVEILQGVRIKRVVEAGGKVAGVMTADGLLPADEVVLAAGAATPTLLEPLGVQLMLDAPAGLLVHSVPTSELLNGLVMSPELHVRQTSEGRLVAGSDFAGDDPGDDAQNAATRLFAKVQGMVKGAEALTVDFHTVGYRPTPPDGVSAIGRINDIQGLYVCVTHSGITLAPALASLGSDEILNGERPDLLMPFDAQRLVKVS